MTESKRAVGRAADRDARVPNCAVVKCKREHIFLWDMLAAEGGKIQRQTSWLFLDQPCQQIRRGGMMAGTYARATIFVTISSCSLQSNSLRRQ